MISSRNLACVAGVLLWATCAAAAELPAIHDPIFHLTMKSSLYENGFPKLPDDMLQACHVNVKPDGAYRYWVLATAEAGADRYVIVTGLVKAAGSGGEAGSKAGGAWSADENGSFLKLSANGCTPVDPANEVFANAKSYADDPAMKIPHAVFSTLADNAVARFSAAYGSFAAFKAALLAQKTYPDKPELSLLSTALKDYKPAK